MADPKSEGGKKDTAQSTVMWSDNEANVDLLRFKYISDEVSSLLTTKELLPVTIGISGDWGSGKSTLIKMVQKNLLEQQTVLVVEFNGWLFEGYEDAKTSLMGTILDAIEDKVKKDEGLFEKVGKTINGLLKRINTFKAIGLGLRYVVPIIAGVPQVSAANLVQDVPKLVHSVYEEHKLTGEDTKDLLKKSPEEDKSIRRSIREFRKDFAKLLEESEIETLVVFIDDLDRCLPDTIIETLEAIKLFLFVPGTAFVIGADERLVKYAVRQRFPELPGTETEVGRDYLEKLIQIPIRVPALGVSDIESYMNLLFAERRLNTELYSKICQAIADFKDANIVSRAFDLDKAKVFFQDNEIPPQLQEDFDLTAQIVPVLASGLEGNPRRTKRFLNTLLLRLSLGSRRGLQLERRILAKLMLLEYIKPEFFRTLANLQAEENGRVSAISLAENTLKLQNKSETKDSEVTQVEISKSLQASTQKEVALKRQPAISKNEQTPGPASRKLPEEDFPVEILPWAADPWTRAWLVSEPPLGDVNLAPYFFIAHDNIGSLNTYGLRLSPAATQVLNLLLSSGEVSQKSGLREAAKLNQTDSVAVFERLAQRIRQSETLDDKSVQGIFFQLIEIRADLVPQFLSLYGSLPDSKITLSTPPFLIRVTKDTVNSEAARRILDRWSGSSRERLAIASKNTLSRK